LGRNERWTTFVPIDASAFDSENASKLLGRPLIRLWFDDDAGITVQVYAAGTFIGELTLPGDDADATEADLEFTNKLESFGVLTRSQRSALLKRMANANGPREWTLEHGFEELLELPYSMPLPTEASETDLLRLLPESALVLEPNEIAGAKTEARKPKATVASKPPPKESWSEGERATLELHCEYWLMIFSLNNWKLYHRYKRHLRADQRPDVDELCNAIGMGADHEVPRRVESILARIWNAEDWDKIIRDPQLVDGDDDVWQAWLARVSA